MPFGASRLAFLAKVAAEAASGGITYRTDTYANNVYLALPFDETNELNDVSPSINSGSTQATLTSGANSTVTTAEVYWTTPSYGKALENVAVGATQSMAYGLSTSIPSASTGTYVIEGWFLADDATTNNNWAISSSDSGGRFLFGVNNGTSFTFGNENNIGIGTGWHHLAIVCDGGTKRFYYDGIYKGAWVSSNTGFSTLHIGQFNASDNNDFRGHIQDFRVTIGSNRGYTGTSNSTSNFTLPESMVESFTSGADAGAAARSTITVNGDAQIDTSRSKFGGASLLLDGTDDWVTITDTTFNSQTAFTWECFFNVDVDAGDGTVSLMSNREGGYGTGDLMLLFRNFDMKLQLSSSGTGGMNLAPPSMSAIATDTWHHVAVSRNSSGDWGLFFNGTRIGNGSGWTQTLDNKIGIGAHVDGGIEANAGTNMWFDEIRISSVDRYNPSSSSITVPTSAFNNDSDTLALLHCDGADGSTTIEDDTISRNAITVTANGNAQVDTTQTYLGTGSAEFDGSGDYLDADGPNLGSGEWTIEMFARFDSVAGVRVLYDDRESANTSSGTILLYTNGTTLYFNSQQVNKISGGPLSANTWYHIAVVRDSSNDVKMYLDGTQIGSSYNDTNTFAQPDSEGWFGMNHQSPNNHMFDGYLDEIRFSNTARYTGAFTPTAAAFTNDANTLMLLHCDGTNGSTTFTDDTGAVSGRTAKTITASGDAQISTAQSKFGTGSLYSDGTTDYLTVTADSDFVFGSNDFTLEAWVRPANTGVGSGDQIISKWSGSNGYSFGLTYGTTSPKNNIRALINDTGGIRGFQVISNPLTVDAWNHVALVVESGTLALYANGNRIGTTSVTAFNDATNADVTISALSGGSYSPNHYQDEIRISDTARYTGSTYTVPSAAFTNDANTLLLLHCDGTNGSTTFTDDNT